MGKIPKEAGPSLQLVTTYSRAAICWALVSTFSYWALEERSHLWIERLWYLRIPARSLKPSAKSLILWWWKGVIRPNCYIDLLGIDLILGLSWLVCWPQVVSPRRHYRAGSHGLDEQRSLFSALLQSRPTQEDRVSRVSHHMMIFLLP